MCNLETNLRMLKIKHDLKYGTKQYLDVSEKTVFGINIGILGADGRMGGAIIRALDAEPRARLSVAGT